LLDLFAFIYLYMKCWTVHLFMHSIVSRALYYLHRCFAVWHVMITVSSILSAWRDRV